MSRFVKMLRRGLETIIAPAEDPRQTFSRTCERQRVLLEQVRQALVNIAAAKNKLKAKAIDVQGNLPQLEDQARQKLREGHEEMARLVVQRYQLVATELSRLESHLHEVEHEEHRLQLMEQRLSAQIEAFYTRMEFTAARYSAAEAQVEISEALAGVSEELVDLGRAMEQAERKSEYMQARAAAIDSLVRENVLELPGSTSDQSAWKLASLDLDQEVETHLLALKSEIS